MAWNVEDAQTAINEYIELLEDRIVELEDEVEYLRKRLEDYEF